MIDKGLMLAGWLWLALLPLVRCEEEARRPHTNNWAVLVCTSAFWFNYRHVANTLAVYKHAKRLGIPDDHIILMLADDMACNGRNQFQGQVFGGTDRTNNVYGEDIEVDYRGCEVTVEMFIRLLTNRLPENTPKSKRLLTDEGSNILVYMTGHGGDNFLKFQDSEEINAYDLADAFEQMKEHNRYHEVLFIIDTCQASTMFERFRSPGIFAISSSMRGESSYSYNVEDDVGVALIDRFTFSLLDFMKEVDIHSEKTIADFMDFLSVDFLGSKPETRGDLFDRDMKAIRLIDFFGNVRQVTSDIPKADGRWFVPMGERPSEFIPPEEVLPEIELPPRPHPNYAAFDLRKTVDPKWPWALASAGLLLVTSALFL